MDICRATVWEFSNNGASDVYVSGRILLVRVALCAMEDRGRKARPGTAVPVVCHETAVSGLECTDGHGRSCRGKSNLPRVAIYDHA
jgi:hypothetical protein